MFSMKLFIFPMLLSRLFKFSILLRRPWAWGLQTRMENVFCFQIGFSSRYPAPRELKPKFVFLFLLVLFPYIWPLAGPNIKKNCGPLWKLAWGRIERTVGRCEWQTNTQAEDHHFAWRRWPCGASCAVAKKTISWSRWDSWTSAKEEANQQMKDGVLILSH